MPSAWWQAMQAVSKTVFPAAICAGLAAAAATSALWTACDHAVADSARDPVTASASAVRM